MKFFNLDLHISVIADIKHIFKELGHEVDNWSISGHSWVMGKKQADVKYVNQNTWRGINKNLANQFYEHYKDELSKYDGFIVTRNPFMIGLDKIRVSCWNQLISHFNN